MFNFWGWFTGQSEDWNEEEVEQVKKGEKESTMRRTANGGAERYSTHPTGAPMIEIIPPGHKELEKK